MAPASFDRDPSRVCVMDASGQVGSTLVERLLKRGYTVHAATQNHDFKFNTKVMTADEKQRLKTFYSDPFDYQTIVHAMRGCSGFFYAFEPASDQVNYDEYMVEEEVRAAHNVIEACAQTETMERVVFSSSATAVVWKENRCSSAFDLDETCWSEPSFCRKVKLWHALGKTLAEKTAWALAMDRGVDMVSINAGLILSSGLTTANPYLTGAVEMYEDGVFVTVDEQFLANANICAYEEPSAYGRYLCFDQIIARHEDAVKLSKMLAPSTPCPPTKEESRNIRQRIHNRKLSQLMMDYDVGFKVGNEAH